MISWIVSLKSSGRDTKAVRLTVQKKGLDRMHWTSPISVLKFIYNMNNQMVKIFMSIMNREHNVFMSFIKTIVTIPAAISLPKKLRNVSAYVVVIGLSKSQQ